MAALVPKTYLYRIYDPSGNYLGLLQNVTSDFSYNQTINTAGVQIEITVGESADTASLPVDLITDETGVPLTDEVGNGLTTEAALEIVGDTNNPDALIANDNLLKVTEYSKYYPGGIQVFDGYISKWKAVFGEDNDIVITAISNGQDMNNYLVMSGDTAYISQATDTNTTHTMGFGTGPVGSTVDKQYIQEFTTDSSSITLGGATFEFTCTTAGQFALTVYKRLGTTPDPLNDTLISSGAASVSATAAKTPIKISAVSSTTLSPSIVYYCLIDWLPSNGASNSAAIYTSNTNPYSGGKFYEADYATGTGTYSLTTFSSEDAYFIIYEHGNSVTAEYINFVPVDILNDIINIYHGNGGSVTMDSLNYSDTTTSYTFKVQTVLQAVQTIQQNLSPANWYWYVDPGTNKLVYNQPSTTADILVVKGRHIQSLELEATKENIKNNVYFTGGDDGTGTNIYVNVTASTDGNRVGLAQLNDNRVAAVGSITKADAIAIAQAIANDYIDENSSETYITTIDIDDSTMDTTLCKLGKVIGFAGFGTMVDQLLLMIVGIQKYPDKVTCQLGSLPVRAAANVATIQSQLAYQQTIDNPSTPS